MLNGTNSMRFSFVIPVNNEDVFNSNVKASKAIPESGNDGYTELIVQKGYTNIGKAFNEANPQGDFVIYMHQDVFLPEKWLFDLASSITEIGDKDWGVLGVAGVNLDKTAPHGKVLRGRVNDRGYEWGDEKGLPAEVDTLDELLFVVKRDAGFVFDENIPTAHFYGADICLQSKLRGKKNYAINAYCQHNSTGSQLNDSFYEAANYMVKKYDFEFATTCGVFSKKRLKLMGKYKD